MARHFEQLHQHGGDVVGSAVLVRHIDQRLHALVGLVGLHDGALDGILFDVAVQAVAAEQDAVALAQLLDEEVGVDVRLRAQAPRDHVAVGVDARLLLGQHPRAHLLGHPRVVERHLAQLAVARDVGAAVADVDEVGPPAVDQQRDAGGAHAGQLGVLARVLEDALVRGAYSVGEVVDDVGVVEAK